MAKRRKAKAKARGPQDDGQVAEVTSSEIGKDERDPLNKRLDTYIEASQTEQALRTPFRDQAVRFLLDDQLAGVPIKKGWGRVQLNKVFPALKQELAIHTQRFQNSDVMAKPMGEDITNEAVERIEGRLRWHYFKNLDIPHLMLRNIQEAQVGANFVNYVYWEREFEWNDDKKEYMARVQVDLLTATNFVIDPECGADLTKARYMGLHSRKELDWALDHWPDDKKRIEDAAKSEAEDEASRRREMGVTGYMARVDPATNVTMDGDAQPGEVGPRPLEKGPGEGALANLVLDAGARRKPDKDDTVERKPRFITVLEIYFLDFEKDESGNPKYPFGRMILRVGTGNSAVILNDEVVSQPRPDEVAANDGAEPEASEQDPQRWWMRDWPFVIGMLQLLPGDTWRGMDSVVMIKSIQDGINDVWRHLEMGGRLFSDPLTMSEKGAFEQDDRGGEPHNLEAGAGTHWKLADNAIRNKRIFREKPIVLSPSLFMLLEVLTQHINDTTGIHEVTRGAQAKGKATATEILQLQTNSRLRVGAQSWYADNAVVALLTMVMRIEKKHQVVGDMIEIVDKNGGEERVALTQAMIDLEYRTVLRVVTALPWDSERTQEKALTLLEAFGAPPALAKMVLKEFNKDLPELDVNAVLTQLQEAAEAAAAAEAAKNAPVPATETASEEIDVKTEAPAAPS